MDKATKNILIATGVIVIGGIIFLVATKPKGKKGKGKGKGLFGKIKNKIKGGGEDDLAERLNTLITKTPTDVKWWDTWKEIKEEIGDNKEEFREAYFDKYKEYPVVTSREQYDGKGLYHIMIFAFFDE